VCLFANDRPALFPSLQLTNVLHSNLTASRRAVTIILHVKCHSFLNLSQCIVRSVRGAIVRIGLKV